ncbi:MAG: hypothetical protein AVDCRST_MAG43-1531 [uncultured Thermomicrobiales bacterium]|uniref:Uncharacterized protein n=1 Tax=uncultured Thermomicrobiales bacterium TaxID=1645740 RepID=A0A6J4US95_9BACT|nr:MAG: hypothetical protein AVDCRST_MAG43-1531 [uncultured Thermomicrobiales bacterium]
MVVVSSRPDHTDRLPVKMGCPSLTDAARCHLLWQPNGWQNAECQTCPKSAARHAALLLLLLKDITWMVGRWRDRRDQEDNHGVRRVPSSRPSCEPKEP